jgi:hypothetical protein
MIDGPKTSKPSKCKNCRKKTSDLKCVILTGSDPESTQPDAAVIGEYWFCPRCYGLKMGQLESKLVVSYRNAPKLG